MQSRSCRSALMCSSARCVHALSADADKILFLPILPLPRPPRAHQPVDVNSTEPWLSAVGGGIY
eukprot:3227831-Rhodomonas_salina.3